MKKVRIYSAAHRDPTSTDTRSGTGDEVVLQWTEKDEVWGSIGLEGWDYFQVAELTAEVTIKQHRSKNKSKTVNLRKVTRGWPKRQSSRIQRRNSVATFVPEEAAPACPVSAVGRVLVAVRVRPLSQREIEEGAEECCSVNSDSVVRLLFYLHSHDYSTTQLTFL